MPKRHKCFKNFEGSSTSMEGDILKEGFLHSLEQHGLIYHKLIADGDCNSLKKMLDAHPYKNVIVKKIECRNHLLRNYSRKIRDLGKDVNAGPLVLRKQISKEQLRLRYAVTKTIEHRKNEGVPMLEKIKLLKQDIDNSISHVFGEHKLCAELGYFCHEQYKPSGSILSDLKMTDLYDKLYSFVSYLSRNSVSLIQDVDNNVSDQFNSIIAKFIGGKRINYCQRGSYQARCLASVISHNTKKPIYTIKKFLNHKSPIGLVKNRELKKKYIKRKRLFQTKEKSGLDSSYGDQCQKPDLTPEELQKEKEDFLASIKKNAEEIKLIEELRKKQSQSDLWHLERRKRLTASNYYAICSKSSARSNGDTKKLVEQLCTQKQFILLALSGANKMKNGQSMF
ncbi:uncharacterized protein LOC126750357 [Anthonomus grandis grandis]|uniref:uncharacterized protein LOC126750357 n=1 Tax=Anthonomus grandis grandis TaxID=2921223 RepID=UPI0021665297|nr:uncharacterized protein LOC126750357 [Anthonomus grandis grandis]XP_050315893.1 uncharacterized protein LOC126750357 [Anthonomus grandis grandis]XP_050315894.1 uncharacterized protein LOC126750357 [Anthonomus grandis grandis]XP_050315895.1 uncharacterized protein LOC126750357 [Anthonomus grandis grandis]